MRALNSFGPTTSIFIVIISASLELEFGGLEQLCIVTQTFYYLFYFSFAILPCQLSLTSSYI